jgi:hypothetical protein
MSNTALGRKLAERGVKKVRTMWGNQYQGLQLTKSATDLY